MNIQEVSSNKGSYCSISHNHNPVISYFLYTSNTTGGTNGVGTAYSFGTPEFVLDLGC